MEFDFVIIGAGSAGCVLANRLTSCGNYSVALIEAGGHDMSPFIRLPVGYFKTMGNNKFDWCYNTEPDAGLSNRSISWPRGKVLGGSSSINGLLYVRGQSQDFDHWKELGNYGWGWNDVLPFFKKSESWSDSLLCLDNSNRGFDGLLAVSEVKTKRRIIDAWIDAAVNTGYKRNFDYNGVIQEGVGYFQQTAKSGIRNSTSYSFLNSIKSRKNLKILKNTLAKKINIKEFKAISVSVENHNQDEIIFAKKEIILSAGTIGSPQLLMLSGIGPSFSLIDKGINPIKNLIGVGKNLQDHLQARVVFKCKSPTLNTEIRNIPKLIQMGFDFITKRRGPFTLAASMGVGFLRTSLNLERPDIQFHIQPFSMEKPSLSGLHKFDAFTTSVCQLRPESTGKIILKSSNIKDYPKIYSNYLSSSQDIEVLIKGVKIARRIASKAPLKNLIVEEFSPGAFVEEDDFFGILDWIKKTAVTIYHPVGTCKMGADKEGVVNQRLCVHGVSDLRVVDASIMPKITSGNTNAPTIMIAEKASDMILRDTVK